MGIKSLTLLAIFGIGAFAYSDSCRPQVRIAIIDTGLDITDSRFEGHICKEGHYNFVDDNTNVKDLYGHGTHVAGLIQKYAGHANYCFLIYKYYSDANPGAINLRNEVKAIQKAIESGANIVNFSGGGPEFDEKEFLTIKDAKDVTFVVAAGNEHENVDLVENYYYPGSYRLPNVIVVGSIDELGNRAPSSNYGKAVVVKELGEHVRSFLPGGKEGNMSGTSQATATHTGKLVRGKFKSCDIGF